MKKLLAIVAIATLTACGGASTTATTVDSTAVVTDSTTSGVGSSATETLDTKPASEQTAVELIK